MTEKFMNILNGSFGLLIVMQENFCTSAHVCQGTRPPCHSSLWRGVSKFHKKSKAKVQETPHKVLKFSQKSYIYVI